MFWHTCAWFYIFIWKHNMPGTFWTCKYLAGVTSCCFLVNISPVETPWKCQVTAEAFLLVPIVSFLLLLAASCLSECLVLPDRQCPGNGRMCDKHLEGIPDFTWSIVAAGDLRQERNGKDGKKEGSPQGTEEGKTEGIMFPRRRGILLFSKHSTFCSCNWFSLLIQTQIWKPEH